MYFGGGRREVTEYFTREVAEVRQTLWSSTQPAYCSAKRRAQHRRFETPSAGREWKQGANPCLPCRACLVRAVEMLRLCATVHMWLQAPCDLYSNCLGVMLCC